MIETPFQYILTHAHKQEMKAYVHEHPECIEEAINLALTDDQPYAWRSAWLLWDCIAPNDPTIRTHIDEILDCIPDKQDGHQRDLIRVLCMMDLDDKQEGRLFDICVTVWEQTDKIPSLRLNAFKFIDRLAKKYPELQNEIAVLTQDQYLESLSPGLKRSVIRMIRQR